MTLASPTRAQSRSRPRPPSWAPPTRLSSAIFAAKMAAFQARRLAQDLARSPTRAARAAAGQHRELVAESVTPLWSDEHLAERAFQLGKVQNLRVAAARLDGAHLAPGQTLSFWREVGRPTAARGFATGRMLQQGCMTPATGGGLCQLSNALYDVALLAGCAIVERHPHSRIVPGSAAAYGRDATVAWNYVDLRFTAPRPLTLTVNLTRDALVVRLWGRPADEAAAPGEDGWSAADSAARSCATCDETECFLHEHDGAARAPSADRRVWLVDEAWPEIAAYVAATHGQGDALGMPLDGARWRAGRYAWATEGYARTGDAAAQALARSWALRTAGPQGARRRQAELDGTAAIARSLARMMAVEDVEVTVAQSYLPFLWRAGVLGGRSLSVLMTRLPMAVLQARLDAAAARRPEARTLSDFRAPAWLVEAEAEALAAAVKVVTPHADIAAKFGDRAERLAWAAPPLRPASDATGSRRIAFPGPTIARKGAWAVREAARALDLEVLLLGSDLEGAGFWDGVRTARPGEGAWTDGLAAVVQPAVVEDQPRRLLAALAAGVPVIASPACGIDDPRLRLVPPDDGPALIAALSEVLRA